MEDPKTLLLLLSGFVIVAIGANQIARQFQKIKLPIITGLLIIGILSGPFFIGLIPNISRESLYFINDISLAFIAFAAAAELYLKDLRDRLKSIKWMTFGQLVVTFVMSSIMVFVLSDYIHFMDGMDTKSKVAVSILVATIFVARSPASAIAVINEMRAKGPFTQTAMGVTVLKDFLVIVLFAINMSLANVLVKDTALDFWFLIILILELTASFLLGILLGRILTLILSFKIHNYAKTFYILGIGYLVYLLYYFIKDYSNELTGKEFLIEPLLICIIGSFFVTNYSKYRYEFIRIIEDVGPGIYVAFFTLTGATMSLDLLLKVWPIALVFFGIRLISMIIGAFVGGSLAGDPPLFNRIGWMPYITQAGVGLGLATIVANAFPEWGLEMSTLIIAVIVLNQIVGPPLFKWSINIVGEGRERHEVPDFDGIRDAIIIGLESQSVALARQLNEHGWVAKIATRKQLIDKSEYPNCTIQTMPDLSLQSLETMDASKAEAIVLMLTDEENLELCETIYQHIGTKDVVVRLNHHYNFEKFHKLGALVVDPSTAIVSLMDHFVRSPQATSLLLGMQEGQDTIDLEVLNPNLHGLPLREIKFPADIIILSIRRRGQMIISHGYTRLRKGDWVTMVGSNESLEKMTLLFDKNTS
ncbi:potassium transporter TrkA [Fulvivirga sp. M361]|uniref:cation:proton antiporter domain-containing protein n=1 Tax=Fulvivirga sp. M361 TaxID=2594266 RepID=UPI00117B6C2B|nr:cation:proton antiporter [Fulvivirga sp. M361]TRX53685.1 potassium transporter TrkA [Fulvivirga sp. M361]